MSEAPRAAGETSAERPHRRLSPLTPVARSGIVLFAAVAAMWRELLRGDLGPTGLVLLGLLVLGAGYGVASWLRTKYWIQSDELRVDTGVVARQSRRIRIDRLQGVDIVQPLVARLFGLAELRMDVAGGGSREGSLAFLKLSDARELREVLLARRDALRAGISPSPAMPPRQRAEAASAQGDAAAERVLARVRLPLLVASTLLTTEALMLAGVVGVATVSVGLGLPGALPATLPVAGGLALVLARKVVGSYDFTVAETTAGLQVRRGLFELSSQTIALNRLQGVVVSEPALWRGLGWARLDVSVAGYAAASGDEGGPSASTVLPVAYRRLVMWLARHLLGGVDPDVVPLNRPPRRARWVSPLGWHFAGAGSEERVVASRQGWFVRRTHLVPHARVQSLRLTQGPVQRRLGLADMNVDSPPGPVAVRARDRLDSEARHLLESEIEASARARRPLRSS